MIAIEHSYANGGGEKSVTGLVFSRHSTTISTFLRKTKLWRDEIPRKMKDLFSSKTKIVCCLDNNQKGFRIKHHRGGISNQFEKVTGTCVKDFIPIDDFMHRISLNPVITHLNQEMPSPYGMPSFETLLQGEDCIISAQNVMKAIENVRKSVCVSTLQPLSRISTTMI